MTNQLHRRSVLIVDDFPENLRLLTNVLKRAGLDPRPVSSGKLAMEAAAADPPEIVLLDISMPDVSGFDVCRWFKKDERLRDIPIIFLSGLQNADDKVEAFDAGGVDYVSKPYQAQEVVARVKTHLQLSRMRAELAVHNQELEARIAEQVLAVTASQMATIFALAKLAEARDDDTGQHIERVQTFSSVLAEQMRNDGMSVKQLNDVFVENLFQTASLHDIGKVGISDAILLKPGKLSAEEFFEMKKHCALGADTLATVLERYPGNQFLRMGVDVARSHHEKWDGTGYPDGLAGSTIPLAARIVAVADFYDALTSNRCYRPAFSHERTCRMIVEGSGTQFDPEIVTAFTRLDRRFDHIRRGLQVQ